MRDLDFIVSGQRLSRNEKCDFSGLVRNSQNYLRCKFSFDMDWTDCIKVAEFGSESVLIEDNVCIIPVAALTERTFQIRVVGKRGDMKITTNKLTIRQGG